MKRFTMALGLVSSVATAQETNPTDIFYSPKANEVVLELEAYDARIDTKVDNKHTKDFFIDYDTVVYTPSVTVGIDNKWSMSLEMPYVNSESDFGTIDGLSNPEISFDYSNMEGNQWLGYGLSLEANTGSTTAKMDAYAVTASFGFGYKFGIFSAQLLASLIQSDEEDFSAGKNLDLTGQFDLAPNQRLSFSYSYEDTNYRQYDYEGNYHSVAYDVLVGNGYLGVAYTDVLRRGEHLEVATTKTTGDVFGARVGYRF